MSTPDIDPGICPLCGEPNGCKMAGPDKDVPEPCWCKSETFPEALLKRIPAHARRLTCICQKCVKAQSNRQE